MRNYPSGFREPNNSKRLGNKDVTTNSFIAIQGGAYARTQWKDSKSYSSTPLTAFCFGAQFHLPQNFSLKNSHYFNSSLASFLPVKRDLISQHLMVVFKSRKIYHQKLIFKNQIKNIPLIIFYVPFFTWECVETLNITLPPNSCALTRSQCICF